MYIMNSKQIAISQIVVALITAIAIMLLTAFTNYESQNITYWMIAIWFIPFSYLNYLASKTK